MYSLCTHKKKKLHIEKNLVNFFKKIIIVGLIIYV